MASLSVVLATYNEEENLPSCLESVNDLADEIIIVDGTSEDKTVEIAKKFNAKVIITENQTNFHINKQKAIDQATKEWVLQLDADEHVSHALASEIREVISQKDTQIDGYWIPRKNWFLGRFLMKGGQYPDYTLRLYRSGKGRLPQKDVHEQAVVDGEVGFLLHPLLHYPYKDFQFYLLKWKRYITLIASQLRHEQKGRLYSPVMIVKQLLLLPLYWFILAYVRHKGFMDSWQGFVFAFFSALRYPASYLQAVLMRK
jgi:glycosyltransferase involved in cell wall biosynthesis